MQLGDAFLVPNRSELVSIDVTRTQDFDEEKNIMDTQSETDILYFMTGMLTAQIVFGVVTYIHRAWHSFYLALSTSTMYNPFLIREE